MFSYINEFVIACGILAVIYGLIAGRSVLSMSPGNEQMQSIAAAIQEGARAYLNRQYRMIAIVGAVIFVALTWLLGWEVGVGFLIGAFLSGLAGYIGMNVSVRANVRTTEAARGGLQKALDVSFKSGAITGLLVVGLGLLGTAGYYFVLQYLNIADREMLEALV